MTVSSDIPLQGTLTGAATQDTIRTGTGTEYHVFTFTNYSGSTVTLDLWVNGVADQNRVAPPGLSLLTNEVLVLRQKLGSGDTMRAEASAATSIAWTDEMDLLS